jgi:bifunctional non-homologous end joining protein LigD
VSAARPSFIDPCVPFRAEAPPTGELWTHQPKLDGFRAILLKIGDRVRIYSRRGVEFRLPGMAEALAELAADTAVIDAELICRHANGRADFYALMREMRTSRPDEDALQLMAFDLMFENGVDLRGLPLTERLRDLGRLLRKARVPCVTLVESFPDGAVLLDHCDRMQLEGVVSKRKDRPYTSGPSKSWLKIKCAGWHRENQQRYRLFEGPKKSPAPTERERALMKKRAELGQVRERLTAPGLRAGLLAALKAQERALLKEIAGLEGE